VPPCNQSGRRLISPGLGTTLAMAAGLLVLMWPARALRSDNFVFYLPSTRAVIPLETIDQAQYLPLLPVLNVVGKVGAIQEKRETLKVWFDEIPLELRVNDKTVRVGKARLALAQPVRRPRSQWLVPVDFLAKILPQITRDKVEYQTGTRRIFVGNVKPVTFGVRVDRTGNGTRVTVQFSDKVTVNTASSNGKWYLYLGDQPVEPLEQSYRFQDSHLSEIQFDDQDGVPKLILTPAAGGLNFYPTLAEGGKILLADIVTPPPPSPQQPAPASQPTVATTPGEAAPPPAGEAAPAVAAGPPLPVVVLDSAHGGEDPGGRARDGALEKDLVAQLAARVRLAILATQKYRVVLTRVGDINVDLDHRETITNTARAVAFFSFHAGNLGITSPRVMVYSYRPPQAEEGDDVSKALLIPWAKIYQTQRQPSRQLATAVQQKFGQIPGVTADPPAEAPIRMLRSINAPAVAVEIGSLTEDADSAPFANPAFLQQIAGAVAAGLEAFRGGTT
jgi:N-acetylmuramoyl-L-alanine amidase